MSLGVSGFPETHPYYRHDDSKQSPHHTPPHGSPSMAVGQLILDTDSLQTSLPPPSQLSPVRAPVYQNPSLTTKRVSASTKAGLLLRHQGSDPGMNAIFRSRPGLPSTPPRTPPPFQTLAKKPSQPRINHNGYHAHAHAHPLAPCNPASSSTSSLPGVNTHVSSTSSSTASHSRPMIPTKPWDRPVRLDVGKHHGMFAFPANPTRSNPRGQGQGTGGVSIAVATNTSANPSVIAPLRPPAVVITRASIEVKPAATTGLVLNHGVKENGEEMKQTHCPLVEGKGSKAVQPLVAVKQQGGSSSPEHNLQEDTYQPDTHAPTPPSSEAVVSASQNEGSLTGPQSLLLSDESSLTEISQGLTLPSGGQELSASISDIADTDMSIFNISLDSISTSNDAKAKATESHLHGFPAAKLLSSQNSPVNIRTNEAAGVGRSIAAQALGSTEVPRSTAMGDDRSEASASTGGDYTCKGGVTGLEGPESGLARQADLGLGNVPTVDTFPVDEESARVSHRHVSILAPNSIFNSKVADEASSTPNPPSSSSAGHALLLPGEHPEGQPTYDSHSTFSLVENHHMARLAGSGDFSAQSSSSISTSFPSTSKDGDHNTPGLSPFPTVSGQLDSQTRGCVTEDYGTLGSPDSTNGVAVTLSSYYNTPSTKLGACTSESRQDQQRKPQDPTFRSHSPTQGASGKYTTIFCSSTIHDLPCPDTSDDPNDDLNTTLRNIDRGITIVPHNEGLQLTIGVRPELELAVQGDGVNLLTTSKSISRVISSLPTPPAAHTESRISQSPVTVPQQQASAILHFDSNASTPLEQDHLELQATRQEEAINMEETADVTGGDDERSGGLAAQAFLSNNAVGEGWSKDEDLYNSTGASNAMYGNSTPGPSTMIPLGKVPGKSTAFYSNAVAGSSSQPMAPCPSTPANRSPTRTRAHTTTAAEPYHHQLPQTVNHLEYEGRAHGSSSNGVTVWPTSAASHGRGVPIQGLANYSLHGQPSHRKDGETVENFQTQQSQGHFDTTSPPSSQVHLKASTLGKQRGGPRTGVPRPLPRPPVPNQPIAVESGSSGSSHTSASTRANTVAGPSSSSNTTKAQGLASTSSTMPTSAASGSKQMPAPSTLTRTQPVPPNLDANAFANGTPQQPGPSPKSATFRRPRTSSGLSSKGTPASLFAPTSPNMVSPRGVKHTDYSPVGRSPIYVAPQGSGPSSAGYQGAHPAGMSERGKLPTPPSSASAHATPVSGNSHHTTTSPASASSATYHGLPHIPGGFQPRVPPFAVPSPPPRPPSRQAREHQRRQDQKKRRARANSTNKSDGEFNPPSTGYRSAAHSRNGSLSTAAPGTSPNQGGGPHKTMPMPLVLNSAILASSANAGSSANQTTSSVSHPLPSRSPSASRTKTSNSRNPSMTRNTAAGRRERSADSYLGPTPATPRSGPAAAAAAVGYRVFKQGAEEVMERAGRTMGPRASTNKTGRGRSSSAADLLQTEPHPPVEKVNVEKGSLVKANHDQDARSAPTSPRLPIPIGPGKPGDGHIIPINSTSPKIIPKRRPSVTLNTSFAGLSPPSMAIQSQTSPMNRIPVMRPLPMPGSMNNMTSSASPGTINPGTVRAFRALPSPTSTPSANVLNAFQIPTPTSNTPTPIRPLPPTRAKTADIITGLSSANVTPTLPFAGTYVNPTRPLAGHNTYPNSSPKLPLSLSIPSIPGRSVAYGGSMMLPTPLTSTKEKQREPYSDMPSVLPHESAFTRHTHNPLAQPEPRRPGGPIYLDAFQAAKKPTYPFTRLTAPEFSPASTASSDLDGSGNENIHSHPSRLSRWATELQSLNDAASVHVEIEDEIVFRTREDVEREDGASDIDLDSPLVHGGGQTVQGYHMGVYNTPDNKDPVWTAEGGVSMIGVGGPKEGWDDVPGDDAGYQYDYDGYEADDHGRVLEDDPHHLSRSPSPIRYARPDSRGHLKSSSSQSRSPSSGGERGSSRSISPISIRSGQSLPPSSRSSSSSRSYTSSKRRRKGSLSTDDLNMYDADGFPKRIRRRKEQPRSYRHSYRAPMVMEGGATAGADGAGGEFDSHRGGRGGVSGSSYRGRGGSRSTLGSRDQIPVGPHDDDRKSRIGKRTTMKEVRDAVSRAFDFDSEKKEGDKDKERSKRGKKGDKENQGSILFRKMKARGGGVPAAGELSTMGGTTIVSTSSSNPSSLLENSTPDIPQTQLKSNKSKLSGSRPGTAETGSTSGGSITALGKTTGLWRNIPIDKPVPDLPVADGGAPFMWVSRRKPLEPDVDMPMEAQGPVMISLPPTDDKRDQPSSGSGNSLVMPNQDAGSARYDLHQVPQTRGEHTTSSRRDHDAKAERERYEKEILEREARKRVKKRTASVPVIPFDEVLSMAGKTAFDRDGSSTPSLDVHRGPFMDSSANGRQTPLQYDSDAVLITTRRPKSRTRRPHDGTNSARDSEQEEMDVAQAISKLRTLKSNQLR